MNRIKVSVVVPTYKPEEYIRECLDALDRQTLSKDNYEVIVILNGCDEPFREFLQGIINGMTCQVNFIHTEVGGVSNARNIGIDAARGEYLFFQDDDDYLTDNYLESMLSLAAPDTIPISNAIAFKDKTREQVPTYRQTNWYKEYSPKGKQRYSHIRGYFSGPWMKLIHRDIIGDRRYDIRFKNGEDGLYNFLLSNRFKYVIFSAPDVIYYRRYRDESAISNLKFNKEIVKNTLSLLWQFTRIFFSGRRYSFRFYATRILATLHTLAVTLSRKK